TSQTCGDGVVQSGCGEECDDGAANGTPGDLCSATCQTIQPQSTPCPATPMTGCIAEVTPAKSSVKLKRAVFGRGGNSLGWSFKTGGVTPKSLFGDPLTTTSFNFCVYDESGGTPALVMSLTVPPGGTCGGKPCWKGGKTGFQYKDTLLTHQGV